MATFQATVEAATTAPGGAIAIEMSYAGETPQYLPNKVEAPAGTVVLFFTNTDKVTERHDFHIGPEIGVIQARMASIGGQTSATVTLADMPAGTYTFWCSVQDHYKVGMVGTLTVGP